MPYLQNLPTLMLCRYVCIMTYVVHKIKPRVKTHLVEEFLLNYINYIMYHFEKCKVDTLVKL